MDTAGTQIDEPGDDKDEQTAAAAAGDTGGQPLTRETAEEPGEDRGPAPAGRLRWLPWVIAVVLAFGCLASLVVAANAQSDGRAERRDREAAFEAATRLATAMVTYDYRDFDATKRRVFELTTGAFRQQYEEGAGAVAEATRLGQATSEGVVHDVFLSEIDEGRARAVVHFDIRGKGVGGERLQQGNFIDLSLVKVEGRWLVDGVQNLNFPLAQTIDGSGAPPSSTP